jgi:hypothetical protein
LYLLLYFFFTPFGVTFSFSFTHSLFSSFSRHCIHSNLYSSSGIVTRLRIRRPRNRGSVFDSCKELPSAQPAPAVHPVCSNWVVDVYIRSFVNVLGVSFSYARDNLIFYLVLHISTSLPFEK